MSRSILAAVSLGLILATGPLRGHTLPESPTPTELPDAVLPAEVDRVLRDFERAWRAEDAKALASLFVEDGFLLQNNQKPVRGRPAIEAAYKREAGGPLRLRGLAFAAGETTGYMIGAYSWGDSKSDIGKFVFTLKRAPGGPWLIFSDIDNLNQSPKPKPAHPGAPSTPPVQN